MPQLNQMDPKQGTVIPTVSRALTKTNDRYSSFLGLGSAVLLLLLLTPCAKASQTPASTTDDDKSVVETVHAQGVQIYECKAGADGKQIWQFREPLATLMANGKTIGRHFAGPDWEFDDGSRIRGKVASQSPGADENDIAILRLDVIEHKGEGRLSAVSAVQRLQTKGGVFFGSCETLGALHLEPYSADYLFLK